MALAKNGLDVSVSINEKNDLIRQKEEIDGAIGMILESGSHSPSGLKLLRGQQREISDRIDLASIDYTNLRCVADSEQGAPAKDRKELLEKFRKSLDDLPPNAGARVEIWRKRENGTAYYEVLKGFKDQLIKQSAIKTIFSEDEFTEYRVFVIEDATGQAAA